MDTEIHGSRIQRISAALEHTIKEIESVLEETDGKKAKQSKKSRKSKETEESGDCDKSEEKKEETEMSEGTRFYLLMLRWFKVDFESKLRELQSDAESLNTVSKDMLEYTDDDVLARDMNIHKLSFESLYDSYKEFINKKLEKSKKDFHKASIKQERIEIKLMVAKTEAKFKKLRKRQVKLEKKVDEACTYYNSLLNNESRYWDHVSAASQEYEDSYKRVAKEKIKFIKATFPKVVNDERIKAKMKKCFHETDDKELLKEALYREHVTRPKFEVRNGKLLI